MYPKLFHIFQKTWKIDCHQTKQYLTHTNQNTNKFKREWIRNKFKIKKKKQKQKTLTRNRARQIIWFNPPYTKNVTSNIAKYFLSFL